MLRQNNRLVLGVNCIVFLALGIFTASIGPLLPELASRTGGSLSEIGAVFTGIFLGALLSQLLAGPASDRFGQRTVLISGLSLLSAGAVLLSCSRSLYSALIFAVLAGLGHGAVTLGANVWVAAAFSRRSVSALNVLNVFYGVGALSGPAVTGLAVQRWDTGIPVLWLSVAIFICSLILLMFLRSRTRAQSAPMPARSGTSSLYTSRVLWVLSLVVLLYVGTENGLGGWTTTYVARTTGVSLATAALVTSIFWLALTAGRIASAAIGARLSSRRLLLASLVGALLGGAFLVASRGSLPWTVVAVALAGFCFGPIYPTAFAIATAAFPNTPGAAGSILAVLGSAGGMLLPWSQGLVLEHLGEASSALFSALGTLAMLVAYVVFLLINRRVGSHSSRSVLPVHGKAHPCP